VSAPDPEVCEDLFGEPTAEPVSLRDCGCLVALPCRHESEAT
jgi:hypothetical protein